MKKYRVKKEWPGGLSKGDILLEDGYSVYDPERWPEYFEEIKKPILVTEDGYEKFNEHDTVFVIVDWDKMTMTVESAIIRKEIGHKVFEDGLKANQYIEENKPKWSDIEMLEFAEFVKGTEFLYKHPSRDNLKYLKDFKKQKENQKNLINESIS